MNVTEPFVLKRDVLLIPCAELNENLRSRMTFEEGDFTLSHRHGRALAQVIDRDTAALLELFREPRTIVEAVIENSRVLGKDPRAWLDELLPFFGEFVGNRVLVPAGSDEEQEIRAQFESGDRIGEWTIVRCASLVEDAEVYQVRREGMVAALKIARMATDATRAVFANEIEILRHLDGATITPRLIESGVYDERPYLVAEWATGVDAFVAAAQRRNDRPQLIGMCASIASAYATLHERGVLHGDVHPRNLMIANHPTLLDFGYSRFIHLEPRIGRGGMYAFFEPEYLAAGDELHATPRGEQYALGALLYLLITGKDYLDFRYDREELVAQVQTEAPLPFAARGVPPWPEVEAILFRALEKDPAKRHDSVAEMASLLARVYESAMEESQAAPLSAAANALLEETLRSFARGGEMFAARYTHPPTANINHGTAGAAVGLLRIAETRGDPALLALADVWRSRAAALIGSDEAFYAEPELTREVVGEVTPFHTESGVDAAGAMIAAAFGDQASLRARVAAFVRASRRPCSELDFTLGRSGSLLAAAMLLPLLDDASLRAFGTETMQAIWDELDHRPPIADSPAGAFLGMAHGWAGFMYAALRWCAASGDALPSRLAERLDEYTVFQANTGRGAYWRRIVDSDKSVPGWCNGTGGQVFLFTLAHRGLRDERWLQLAERTAWHNWEAPRLLGNLCCGTAGRAYALLNFYKHTGASEWLGRARQLANHAASVQFTDPARGQTLWKGSLGVAVLIADLASPENARMPFFE